MGKVELLSPVSDRVSLRAAIQGGADSVYFGVKQLNMRALAKNFELSELPVVVDICHQNGVRAYLTVNTVVYDNELSVLEKILDVAARNGIDGIIAWDFAVIRAARRKGLDVHISTQASVSNYEALKFFVEMGAVSVNLARELSISQIRLITENVRRDGLKVDIEVFCHGAMCVSISGRCFMSQELFRKSANRGECIQPCRREYLVRDVIDGREMILGTDYIMSPKDLCTIPILDRLIASGITRLKIEGRNRNAEYVKVVTESYRRAIDAVESGEFNSELADKLISELQKVYNRGLHTGFYLGVPTADDFSYDYGSVASMEKRYVGFVRKFYKRIGVAEIKVETGALCVGDRIMVQGPTTGVVEQIVESMEIEHKPVTRVEKGQAVGVKSKEVFRPNDKVFVVREKESVRK